MEETKSNSDKIQNVTSANETSETNEINETTSTGETIKSDSRSEEPTTNTLQEPLQHKRTMTLRSGFRIKHPTHSHMSKKKKYHHPPSHLASPLDRLRKFEPIEISDWLFLGNRHVAAAILEGYNPRGISKMINVCDSLPDFKENKEIDLYNVPMKDDYEPYWTTKSTRAHELMDHMKSQGCKVLVFCKHGRRRSVSTIIAWLMKNEDQTLNQAETHVRNMMKKRGCEMDLGWYDLPLVLLNKTLQEKKLFIQDTLP